MNVLLSCMYVHMVLVPEQIKEGIRFPETGAADVCEVPCGSGNQTWALCKSNRGS